LKKVIVIDNYDSFVYNIVQYIGEVEPGCAIEVYRNDAITVEEIENRKPTHIVISPGPGRPENAGVSVEVVKKFSGKIPILGVCLGHQAIGVFFGCKLKKARRPMHGIVDTVFHNERGLFRGLKNPLHVVRYHSLVIDDVDETQLEVTAVTKEGEIMGIRHKKYKIEGVQFHPESIATECGLKMLENFLKE